jgi:predicted RNA-binding Zn-ribbon protein involved in translation (DUF1610 family)
MKRCWYFITEFYCPACGHTKAYRERKYTKKPKTWGLCHEVIEAWDGCDW